MNMQLKVGVFASPPRANTDSTPPMLSSSHRSRSGFLKKILFAFSCVALTIAGTSVSTEIQAAYPTHEIDLVVGYPPGGATDIVARVVAQHLSERLKKPVVVNNRPGASGMVGARAVANASPDGYTLLFTAADTHSLNPHLYKDMGYDARKDVTPIGLVGYLPLALVTRKDLNVADTQQFVELAKKADGALTYASFGVGSSSQVAMEMLSAAAGIELLHIPFQGAAPAITAIMGGHVDSMMVPLPVAEPNAKAGKVNLLGLAASERFSSMQSVHTLKEQGIDVDASPWIGILGPANVPDDVVARLNQEINVVMGLPAVQKILAENGVEVGTMTQPEFKNLMDTEYERWGKTIRDAGIMAEEPKK